MKNRRWWSSQGRNRTPNKKSSYHEPSRRDKRAGANPSFCGGSPSHAPLCHARPRSGIQGLWFFVRGFAPARRGSFDFASFGFAPLRSGQALRPFDKLRTQDSPRPQTGFGTGAQPRPEAPGQDICICCHSRLDRESSVFILRTEDKTKTLDPRLKMSRMTGGGESRMAGGAVDDGT